MPPSAELNAGLPGPAGTGPDPGPAIADVITGDFRAGEPAGGAVTSSPVAEASRLARRNGAVIAGAAGGFAVLLVLQSLLYGRLTGITEYDDGVHLGAALQFIHGVLPYRDFAFLQPPMVAVWLAPFAALSGLTGTAHALVAARLFTDLIAIANIVLAGLLVRHRPTLQVAVTTGFLACYPATVAAAKTVMLEPLVVFWCLIALLLILRQGQITGSGRRILIGGLVFGIAGATKTWAVLPMIAVLAVPWGAAARQRLALIAGAAIGFAACVMPFLIAAPSAFVNQVLVVQAIRNGGGFSASQRLADLTGLPGLTSLVTADRPFVVLLLVIYAAAIALLWPALTGPRRLAASDPLGWFGLLASVITGLALLLAPTYFYHYAAFAAPFIALAVGSLVAWWRDQLAGRPDRRATGLTAALPAAAVVLIAVMAVARLSAIVTAPAPVQVGGKIAAAFPASGCVVSLSPSVPILANRFTSAAAGCPRVIDWLGEERVLDHGVAGERSDVTSPAVQAMFQRWFSAAAVIVTQQKNPGWDPAVAAYVRQHFRLVRVISHPYPLYLYVRG